MIKLGPDKGNSGAIIRWGADLDNGIWINYRRPKLWLYPRWHPKAGYIRLGPLALHWGN